MSAAALLMAAKHVIPDTWGFPAALLQALWLCSYCFRRI